MKKSLHHDHLSFSSANSVYYSLYLRGISVISCVKKMASPASFTIRQVAPEQPEVTVTEPPAEEPTDKSVRRRTVRDKRLKGEEEKKKTKKPPGYNRLFFKSYTIIRHSAAFIGIYLRI